MSHPLVNEGGKKDVRVTSRSSTTTPGGRVVDAGVNPNIRSAVCTNVVLIGAELAALSRDSFQLLLRRCVGVADLHQHALLTNRSTMVLFDDVLALLASFEAGQQSATTVCHISVSAGNLPSKANSAAVAHAVTENLARNNMIAGENGIEFLATVRHEWRSIL